MRTAAAATALGLTLLAAAGLAACTPDDPVIPPDPLPSSTPVFASEEEALAAAEDAYGAYLNSADEISAESGKDPERIEQFASGQLLEDALEGFSQLHDKHWRTVGSSTVDSFTEQFVDLASPVVVAYVCVDVSAVDVLDEDGKSVVSPDRPDRQAFEVTFEMGDLGLLPDQRSPWTGGGVCV
ncbi:MAG TPA: hypothetical protein VF479_01480 [Pseudolysinimonas sp.]